MNRSIARSSPSLRYSLCLALSNYIGGCNLHRMPVRVVAITPKSSAPNAEPSALPIPLSAISAEARLAGFRVVMRVAYFSWRTLFTMWGKVMALRWLKSYQLMSKNTRSVLGLVCLLAWLVPVESWAQGSFTSCGSVSHQESLLKATEEVDTRILLQAKEVTQAVFGGYSFEAACQAHDACYGDCRTPKPVCDEKLRTDASAVCKSTWNKSTCNSDAQAFFLAVSKFGGEPFNQARGNCPDSIKAVGNQDTALPSGTDVTHIVESTTSGLSGDEVAKALDPTKENARAAAIAKMVRQGAIRSPLTANELAAIL